MKRVSKEGLKSGKATVKQSKDGTKFQITFDDGFQAVVDKEDCPDAMQKGNWFVTLNDEGGVMGLRPYGVIAKGKFSHFVTDENDVPTPKEYSGQYGPYLGMTSLINLGGEYKGMVQPHFTIYKFVEYEGTAVLQGGGAWVDKLQATLEAYGVWDQDIPFSDNLLPTLQKLILAEGRVFSLTINKEGFSDSIMELPQQESVPDDDFAQPAVESTNDFNGDDDNDDFSNDEDEDDLPF